MFRDQEVSAGVSPMWISIRRREAALDLSLGKSIGTVWMGKFARNLSKDGWLEGLGYNNGDLRDVEDDLGVGLRPSRS